MSLQSNYTAFAARRAAERTEDLLWMIETGESMVGAAARLGISPNSLQRWCHRRGLHEEAATLLARNPIDPDVDPSEAGRKGAAVRWAGEIDRLSKCRSCQTLNMNDDVLRRILESAARRASHISNPETDWGRKIFSDLDDAKRQLAEHEATKATHLSGHESERAS